MIKEYSKNSFYKKLALILVIVYILMLIPVLLISKYNYPCVDDFSYGSDTHIVWEETHSIISVIKQAIATTQNRYITWQGTFATIFLMTLQPAVFGEEFYFFVPFIMIGMLTFSLFYFFRNVFIKNMGMNASIVIVVTMSTLILSTQCIIDKNQAFFWFNGAAHYLLPFCATIIFIGLSLSVLREKNRIIVGCKIIGLILGAIFIGGGNYISALFFAILMLPLYILMILQRRWRNIKIFLAPTAGFIVSFLVNVTAPGNVVRQEAISERLGVFKSILLSFYYCNEKIMGEWTDWKIIFFMFFIIPFIWKMVCSVKYRFCYPLLVVLYSYCLLAAMFTPTLYAIGNPGTGRIYNIIYLTYILLLVLNCFYCLGWLKNHFAKEDKINNDLGFINGKMYLITVIFLMVGAMGLSIKVNENEFTFSSAILSLRNDEARLYSEENKERLILLEDESKPEVALKSYENRPYLLFFDDISTDPDDWRNKHMCRFYQKEKVYILDAEK